MSPRLLALLLVSAVGAPALASEPRLVPFPIDSGALDNPDDVARVVFVASIELGADVAWLQVVFGDGTVLPAGSAVTVTSVLDGDIQPLDAAQLAQWGGRSAYFNGGAAQLALLAGPRTRGNRLLVDGAWAGTAAPATIAGPGDTICGTDDDRVPSSDPAVGRLMISGDVCTGSILDVPTTPDGRLHVSAGHCLFGASNAVLQFSVPDSTDQCQLVNPPAFLQFAVDIASSTIAFGSPDDDWAVFETFPNAVTGRTSFEQQQAALRLAAFVPEEGDVRVVGHGADGNEDAAGGANGACFCDPKTFSGTRHTTQQMSFGPISGLQGGVLSYAADTCGGNSGSPVLDATTDEVLAIHGDGFCTTAPDTANVGTPTSSAALRAALAAAGSSRVLTLGGGLAGAVGVPEFSGQGTLVAGSPLTLSLSGAAPGATSTLVVSAVVLAAPFKGGLLVPKPDVLIPGLPIDGAGELELSAIWPAGLPPGASLTLQHWITDATGPFGFAASNAVVAITP